MQQALDKCTQGSPSVIEVGVPVLSQPLPCTGARACVQPPPAATGSQKSQLLGRPSQLRTPVPAGPLPARPGDIISVRPRRGKWGN